MNKALQFSLALLILLNISGYTYSQQQDDLKVVLVNIVVRHGVRSILENYPTDPIPVSYWDKYGGTGQLTPVGMRQHYEFGKNIRQRYRNFLSRTYSRSKVYARSTNYDRTLQSLTSFLAGLFQPNADQKWNIDGQLRNWLPIPVHTEASATDKILHSYAPCPRYTFLKNASQYTQDYLNQVKKYKDFIEKMADLSGLSKPLNYYDIYKIADNALVDIAHAIPLPKWVKDHWENITIANDYTFLSDYRTIEMAKLYSGPVLDEIIKSFNAKVGGSKNELYVYGVHDTYITAFQRILNSSNEYKQPPFGSAYIFELLKNSNGRYFVRVYYKDDEFTARIISSLKPKLVTVYGCQETCPLEDFIRLTADKVVTDIEAECNVPDSVDPGFPN